MTTNSLRWVIGSLCALLGSMMLVVPHQFGEASTTTIARVLPWWGGAGVLAGAALLGQAGFVSSRRPGAGAPLLAAVVLLALACSVASHGEWLWGLTYVILAVGTSLIPLVPVPPETSQTGPTGKRTADLFVVVVGVTAIVDGLVIVLADLAHRPLFSLGFVDDGWWGIALVIVGGGLLVTQLATTCSPLLFRVACVTSAATFLAIVATLSAPSWSGALGSFGSIALVLAALPWLGPHLQHTERVSLRRRLTLALALAASVPLVLAATVTSDRVEQTARHEALATQRTLATALAQDIASYIGLNGAAVAALAAQPGLATMAPDDQRALLRAMRRNYPDITDFMTFDMRGVNVARSDDRPNVLLAGTLIYPDSWRTRGPWLDILAHPTTGEPVFVLGAPIRRSDGDFAGLVVGVVEAERLVASLSMVNTSVGEIDYLVDSTGRVIAHPASSNLAAFADVSSAPPVASLLAGDAGVGALSYDSAEGSRLAGWASVPGLGWSVVTDRSTSQALATVHAGRELTFEMLLVGVASAVVAGVIAAGWLAAPLRRVTEAVDRFAAGDSRAPLPQSRIAEVARLSAGFGELRDRLAARTAERERTEAALQHTATHDALTGLPNRALLNSRLHDAVIAAERDGEPLILLLMDLNRFKEVNDTLGHQAGDLLLQQVARRLQHELRPDDLVARLGGDEFSVILPNTAASVAEQICRRLLHVLEQPFSLDGHPANIGGSIGIAVWPEHGRDSEALMRAADVAMYAAKRSHAGCTAYTADLDDTSPDRLTLLGELRAAIDENQLELHYQPIINLETYAVTEVEALVRWNDPRRGQISPGEFVPLMDQMGLSSRLSTWVLDRALQDCQTWRQDGLAITVAVNVSAQTLHDASIVSTVTELLERRAVAPNRLTLEITESSIMADPAQATSVLTALHEMGVRTAIDDFGTGYSSLSYIKRLPMHVLKIDQSFVRSMMTDERDCAIVRSAIELGHNLGLELVAEGVEDVETRALLASLGCDRAQGYCISPPLPPEELERWLDRWAKVTTTVVAQHALGHVSPVHATPARVA